MGYFSGIHGCILMNFGVMGFIGVLMSVVRGSRILRNGLGCAV